MTTPIVAGTDGSEESLAAVAWAATEAARRRVPLCIFHVLDPCHGSAAAHALPLRHDATGRLRHGLPHPQLVLRLGTVIQVAASVRRPPADVLF
jgi:nucleotide-binding universal stress UspA family protein